MRRAYTGGMQLYPLVLFIHVTADIAIFVGLGVQLLTLTLLRRAQTVEQARVLVPLFRLSNPLGIVGALLTIASGFYLALTVWGLGHGWIVVTLGSLALLLPPLIGGLIEPRTRALVRSLAQAPPGPLPAGLRARLHDPLLATALHTAAGVVLGIVFLMTTKPSLLPSLAAMLVFVVAGAASGWVRERRALKQ